MNLKVVTPALAIALSVIVVLGTAPQGSRKFAARLGPVGEAARSALPPSAKPLLILFLDGGYWAHRAPCWAGLLPITILYDSGAVITLPPKRTWVRGQLEAPEFDQLRELAAKTDLRQYVGKGLTAVNGSDMAILHVFSAVSGPPVEVQVYGYSPFDYDKAEWEHGDTPAPLARLIDALFSLRQIESAAYVLPSARVRIVDTGESCAGNCPWPQNWAAAALGSREVPLRTGDLHELAAEWEQTCPREVGRPGRRSHAFCKNDKQFAWCAGPVFPGVPDGVTGAAFPHR